MSDIDGIRDQFAKLIEGKTLTPRAQEMASLVQVAIKQWPRLEPADRDALRAKVMQDIEALTIELSR